MYLIPRKESFIVRMNDRTVLFKGEKILLKTLAKKYKGKYNLKFETKDGDKADCKISIVPVSLPDHPSVPLRARTSITSVFLIPNHWYILVLLTIIRKLFCDEP
ncbi:hypothetical protein FACS1894187_17480 [Synergistales bacterium]|nr:hypothetical protein FACS1894187_17480 [Synergistales bacterium]